jgi:small subunit ribosomal protein S17
MAEEEKQDTEETTEEPAEEKAPAGAAEDQATEAESADEPEAEQAEADPAAPGREAEEADGGDADPAAPGREAEEADGGDSDADGGDSEAPEAEEAPAEDAEPEETLSPKQLRKRERSRAGGQAKPQRGPEERATERAEARQGAAVRRRRYRVARRAKRGEPGQGTPKPEREPGSKRVRQGTVVSAAADKTITVEIPVVRRHPTYEKVVRRTSKLHAHDEANTAHEGDVVRVIESRPLSRTKRWRLLDVVERSR